MSLFVKFAELQVISPTFITVELLLLLKHFIMKIGYRIVERQQSMRCYTDNQLNNCKRLPCVFGLNGYVLFIYFQDPSPSKSFIPTI